MRANNRLISVKANLRDAQVKRLWRGRSQNSSCRSVHVKDEKWSATANLRDAQVKRLWRGRSQNQIVVRFWIITMMLVLAGLSTVKLR